MKKVANVAKAALAIFGAAFVLGTVACSSGSDSANPIMTITTPVPATGGADNGGSGGKSQQQPSVTYTITVESGTAKNSAGTVVTSAAAGDVITIVANAPAIGMAFKKWKSSTAGLTFESETAATTTFTMPASAVSVTATYKYKPAPVGFVTLVGSTVVGDNKFILAGKTSSKGVFVQGRSVAISTFYMCNHEVTQAEYSAVMESNPSSFKGERKQPAAGETQEKRPVENVSWYDAIYYCNKKSLDEHLEACYAVDGKDDPNQWGYTPHCDGLISGTITCDFSKNGYRLPTEAEWEYAARGGKDGCEAENPTDWAGTDHKTELGKYAWYDNNSDDKTHEVKTKRGNSLNLYDMSGNVWEWCWDRFDDTTTPGKSIITADMPATGATSGSRRVHRGGSYRDVFDGCTVAGRSSGQPERGREFLGFRVIRSAD